MVRRSAVGCLQPVPANLVSLPGGMPAASSGWHTRYTVLPSAGPACVQPLIYGTCLKLWLPPTIPTQSGCLVALWITNRERHRRFIDAGGPAVCCACLCLERVLWLSGNSQPECAVCLAGNVRLPAPDLRLASCQLRGRYGCTPPRGTQLSSAAPFLPTSLSLSRAAAGLGPAPRGHLALDENHRPRAAGQPAGEPDGVVTKAGSGSSLLRCCVACGYGMMGSAAAILRKALHLISKQLSPAAGTAAEQLYGCAAHMCVATCWSCLFSYRT